MPESNRIGQVPPEILTEYRRMLELGLERAEFWDRSRAPLHLTVSLRALNAQGAAIVIDHPKLGIKTYPGGHLETDSSLLAGCLREAREEVGLEPHHVTFSTVSPVGVGFHFIPHSPEIGSHWHADLLFECVMNQTANLRLDREVQHIHWENDLAIVRNYVARADV